MHKIIQASVIASSTCCFSTGFQIDFNVAVPLVFVGIEALESPMFEVKEGMGVDQESRHIYFAPRDYHTLSPLLLLLFRDCWASFHATSIAISDTKKVVHCSY
jgi:hypothetical protein